MFKDMLTHIQRHVDSCNDQSQHTIILNSTHIQNTVNICIFAGNVLTGECQLQPRHIQRLVFGLEPFGRSVLDVLIRSFWVQGFVRHGQTVPDKSPRALDLEHDVQEQFAVAEGLPVRHRPTHPFPRAAGITTDGCWGFPPSRVSQSAAHANPVVLQKLDLTTVQVAVCAKLRARPRNFAHFDTQQWRSYFASWRGEQLFQNDRYLLAKVLGIRRSFGGVPLLQYGQGLCDFATGVLVHVTRLLGSCEPGDGLADASETRRLDHDGAVTARKPLRVESIADLARRHSVSTRNGDVEYIDSELEPLLQHTRHDQKPTVTCIRYIVTNSPKTYQC